MRRFTTLASLIIVIIFNLFMSAPGVKAWETRIDDQPGYGTKAVIDSAGDVIAVGTVAYGSDVVKFSGATGEVIWRYDVQGHESRNYAQDMAIDSRGNVFVVFAWTRVVIKVSGATGAKMWEKPIGGTLNALLPIMNAVVVDGDDNVVTGGTMGGYFNVCKLDGQTGDEKWHYDARGGYAMGVAVDSKGDVAAAGMMSNNFATVKLSGTDGHELWQREINGPGNFTNVFEEARAIAVSPDDGIVVAGVTVDVTGEFDDCTKEFTVIKYSADGERKWMHAINGRNFGTDDRGHLHNSATDEANAVAIDGDGDVVVAGSYQVSPEINVSAPEHFQVFKFSGADGRILWGNAAEETPLDGIQPFGRAFAVAVDAQKNVVAVGMNRVSFVVVKYSESDGKRLWRKQPFTGTTIARDVVTDSHNDVVVTGESLGAEGLSRFTVIKLRGEDGADYFAAPTPTVPETVRKYAPLVYLHPDDPYRPGNPTTFIQRSKLGWSHQATLGGFPCGDHFEAGQGAIDVTRLGELSSLPYAHNPKDNSSPICRHREDIELKAYDYTRPFDGSNRDNILGELNGYMKEGFYLDPDDGNDLRAGIGNGAPVFYEYVQGKYVTYWFFYPYNLFRNSVVNVPLQAHEGDWEHISIQLDPNDMPVNVYYSSHHAGNLVPWSLVDKYQDTHPIVFSAKGSHAAYPAADHYQIDGPDVITGFDHTDYGPQWNTWNNLLQVESQPWYGFGGAWGEVGEVPTEILGLGLPITGAEYTGPLGPSKYKNSRGKWLLTVSGQVTDFDGRGLSGAKLTLADTQGNVVATKSTDTDGRYFFADLTFGRTYAVVPSKESYSFTPVVRVLRDLRENQTADFKVLDTTPPVLNLPSDITVNAVVPQGTTVYYTVTATDDVTGEPRISCSLSSGAIFPIGATTVTCTAVDGAGNESAKGSFRIVVKGGAEQLVSLTTLVRSFSLHNGTETSLLTQLQAADDALKQGRTTVACNSLNAFINHVRAQSGKKITTAQANQMIAAANQIRGVLGCR